MSKINKLLRQRCQPIPVGGRSKVKERNHAFSMVFGLKQQRSAVDQRQWEESLAKKKATAEEIKKIDEAIARKRAEIILAKEAERKAKLAAVVKAQRPKPPVRNAKERPAWRLIPIDIPIKEKKYEHFIGYHGTFADPSTPRCRNCNELMFYATHICRGL